MGRTAIENWLTIDLQVTMKVLVPLLSKLGHQTVRVVICQDNTAVQCKLKVKVVVKLGNT